VTQYAFYFLSFLAVLGALMVVFSKNAVYSVIFLVMTFFTIACHYMLLNAQFLAAVHVIVYAGAIMVLFLYVIMMMNLNDQAEQKNKLIKIASVVTGGLMLVLLTGVLRVAETELIDSERTAAVGTVKHLGKILLSDFLLPFEAVSILLLTAMVGAVMLAKTHRKKKLNVPVDSGEIKNEMIQKEEIEKITNE
jgi:NADH-quinone oxidoreductase subunit J